jgi:hypothetical protein
MVKLTKDAIILTIDCKVFNPVEVLTDIKKSMLDMSFLAMSNTDFCVSDMETLWFTEVFKAFCDYEKDTFEKISDSVSS